MDKLKIIDEYRQITEQIAVLKSQKITEERGLTKLTMAYRPSDLKGLDYSEEIVQRSSQQPNMFEIADGIINAQRAIRLIEVELESWYKQRDDLETVINNLGDVSKQVLMLKIKGLKHWEIAIKLHCSQSNINKISRQINKVCHQSVTLDDVR